MEFIETGFEGLWVIQPKIFEDPRGYFYESYNKQVFDLKFPGINFVQDNQSESDYKVLRGLHFQSPPHSQIKLIRVIKGAVLDVVVDVRKTSRTYGKHFKIELTDRNKTMIWIPVGFAHGFATLEDKSIFLYKCSSVYNKASEYCLSWNDPDLNIDWNIDSPLISEKDRQGIAFNQLPDLF